MKPDGDGWQKSTEMWGETASLAGQMLNTAQTDFFP
jgi:hypothetical protein